MRYIVIGLRCMLSIQCHRATGTAPQADRAKGGRSQANLRGSRAGRTELRFSSAMAAVLETDRRAENLEARVGVRAGSLKSRA